MFTCYLGHPWCNLHVKQLTIEEWDSWMVEFKKSMVKGYGNTHDPAPVSRDDSVDQPHPKRSMTQKILATLPPVQKDTPANRRMAKANGWTEEQYQSWVNGESEGDSEVRDG